MSDIFAVYNCPNIVICDQRWENLHPTDIEGTRLCGECEKEVALCKDWDHFNELEEQGFCVAYKCYTERDPSLDPPSIQVTVGIPRRENR
jgi:hypothetical protein